MSTTRPALVLPLLLAASACAENSVRVPGRTVEGSGSSAVETREVSGFRKVAYSLPGELTIVRGDAGEVRIEADDNLVPRIETRVRNGVLEIGSGGSTLRPSGPLRVRLTTPALEGVIATGAGSVDAPGLRGEEVSVTLAGSGDVRAHDLETARLRVDVAGSGNAVLSGRASRQVLTIAGSGDVDAVEVASDAVEATIAGSGSARVHARERIRANLVGSGSVLYRGDPEISTTRVGSGTVTRLEP